jgi:hypothetical protein
VSYELEPGPDETTRVQMTIETVPATPTDRLMEMFGARTWTRRQHRRALSRLRSILEEGSRRGARATIAGR